VDGVLKARAVRLAGERFVDSATRAETAAASRSRARQDTATALYRRRIEALKRENDALRAEAAALRAAEAERQARSLADGHAAGVSEGRRQVEEELVEAFRLLEGQAGEFRRAAAAYHRQADRELVRLARWMAEAVLRRELAADDEALARRVRDLLEACLDQQSVRLHVHPGERRRLLGEEMAARLPRLAELVESLRGRLEWVEAPDVPPGACRVELHDGLLEAAPAAMLDHLAEGLSG